jgi:hypothetical protein
VNSILTRADAERALSHALSRYIGYTTAAYDLDRIISVLEFFADRPSAYKEEIVAGLRQYERDTVSGQSSGYLSEVLNFAQAMGFVSTVSSREVKLQRMAATELGRSLLGAKAAADSDFFRFYLTHSILLADVDYLIPVLTYFSEADHTVSLIDFFVGFQKEVRERRRQWLKAAFPERVLLDRVIAQISWLSPPRERLGDCRIEIPTKNTARHHATPRQGWLSDLGLLDRNNARLTALGHDILAMFRPHGRYFWLGPPENVQSLLRINPADQVGGPFEDSMYRQAHWREPSDAEAMALARDLSRVMIETFTRAKLIHAEQASLVLPVEYVNYRAFKDRILFEPLKVIEIVFENTRSSLERLSAHKGQIGFYRVK